MILLDTHIVFWLGYEPHRISRRAAQAISAARKESDALGVCDVSLLEIATLARKGRINIAVSLESLLEEIESRFVVYPITAKTCARSATLASSYPKDPVDRIIAATAIVEGVRLVTADRQLRAQHDLSCVW